MAVTPIPAGYHSVTPYLVMDGAAKAIDFYKQAFDATELFRMPMPDGKVAHAEIKIGDSPIMMADEQEEHKGPKSYGGTPVSLMIYVKDVDRVFKQAIAAGGKEQRPVVDQFYGDRSGTLVDPFGHIWTVATHVEDVSPEEMDRRMAKMMQGSA
jgi:PhnB protein